MSLPVSHIFSGVTFRHIGLMIAFMQCLCFTVWLGFIHVHNLTETWKIGSENTLILELSALSDKSNRVIPFDTMREDIIAIEEILANDPIIETLDVQQAEALENIEAISSIPAPAFIVISLKNNRAENAEMRLIRTVQRVVPRVSVIESETWRGEIDSTILNLHLLPGICLIAVLSMTIIMVSATIRMQLIAAKDTINLVHLMGAETGRIAWLFEKAILNACLGGAFISGVVIIGLSALLATLALFNTVNYLSISLAVIVITVMFTVLSWATTRLTVVNQLKDLP